MKKCNNCGAEIPKSAAYCDICGSLCSKGKVVLSTEEKKERDRKREKRRKIIKRILLTIGGLFLLLLVIAIIDSYIGMKRYEISEKRRDLSGWEVTVTPEEYEKLDVDMTYEEIRDIVGGDGKKIEKDKYSITYAWPGDYYINSYHGLVEVTFDRHYYDSSKTVPTVRNISEYEIVDGREAYETNKLMEDSRFSELDTPIVTKDQAMKIGEGMSYEQACEILGGEGKIYESYTWTTNYDSDTRTSYVWRCKSDGRDFYYELDFEDGIIKYLGDWRLKYVD